LSTPRRPGGGIPEGDTRCATAQRVAPPQRKEFRLRRRTGDRVGNRNAVVQAAGGKSEGLVPGGGGQGGGGLSVHALSTGSGRRATVPTTRSSRLSLLPPGFHPQSEQDTRSIRGSLHVGVRPARGLLSSRRISTADVVAGRAFQGANRSPPDGAFEKEGNTGWDSGAGLQGRRRSEVNRAHKKEKGGAQAALA